MTTVSITTVTYPYVRPTQFSDSSPFIDTSSCGISCIFTGNNTVCMLGTCTHLVYTNDSSSYYNDYNECSVCDLANSFCFQGFCYRMGNSGDMCLGDYQCQTSYCSSNICTPKPLPSLVQWMLYSITIIIAIAIAAYLIQRCIKRRYYQDEIYHLGTRQSVGGQTSVLESEDTENLPPYETSPPKYEEAARDMRRLNE